MDHSNSPAELFMKQLGAQKESSSAAVNPNSLYHSPASTPLSHYHSPAYFPRCFSNRFHFAVFAVIISIQQKKCETENDWGVPQRFPSWIFIGRSRREPGPFRPLDLSLPRLAASARAAVPPTHAR
jgi:hypothetical protein